MEKAYNNHSPLSFLFISFRIIQKNLNLKKKIIHHLLIQIYNGQKLYFINYSKKKTINKIK